MRRIFLLALLGVGGVLLLSWALYVQHRDQELDRAAGRAEGVTRHLAETLLSEGQRVQADLVLLSGLESLRPYIEDPTEGNLVQARRDFRTFAESRPEYFQIRLLDLQGREQIRLDREGGSVRFAGTLQDKSDRYYFQDMIRMEPGAIYISPLDWNIEFGKVELPKRPTLRIGRREGWGLVLLNADARVFLRALREASAGLEGGIRLTDREGRLLVEASAGSWEFFPESGSLRSREGDVSWGTDAGWGNGAWILTTFISHDVVVAQIWRGFRDHLLFTGLLLVLLLLAAALAVRSSRRTMQLEMVRRNAHKIEAANLELRRTRELLVERTRLATLGEMVPVLAHEVRNPLQAMLAAVGALRQGGRDKEDRELLELVAEEIARLDRIVTEQLVGHRRRPPERCDLSNVVRRVGDLFQANRLEEPGAELDLEVAASLPPVLVSPDTVTQVLWNILRNAAAAAGPTGRIWIRTAVESDRVVLRVEDDGPGFGRGQGGGNGIGLSLCEQLVQGEGGRLEFGTSSRGGACVRLSFSVLVEEEVPV